MVAVIVSQQYTADRVAVNAVVEKLLGDIPAFDAGIDEQASSVGADIGAVAAAAAAERDETQGATWSQLALGDFGQIGIGIQGLLGVSHDYVSGDVIAADVNVVEQSGKIVQLT